jgi:hypothetical protein
MLKKIVMALIACVSMGCAVNAQESSAQEGCEQEQALLQNMQFSLSESAQLIKSLGASAQELRKKGLSDDQIFRALQCELETNSKYAGVKHFAKRGLQLGALVALSLAVGAVVGVAGTEIFRALNEN